MIVPQAQLKDYQDLIDAKGIKDERLRRAAAVGHARFVLFCSLYV